MSKKSNHNQNLQRALEGGTKAMAVMMNGLMRAT